MLAKAVIFRFVTIYFNDKLKMKNIFLQDYRKQVPDSLNIQEQPYLSLWPSEANRRREDSASVREAAVSSISSRDKIASSNRVPNRKKYQNFIFFHV